MLSLAEDEDEESIGLCDCDSEAVIVDELFSERGEIKAELTTALPISNEINNTLIKEVKKLTKSEKIELKTNVDKSLIGGLVLQVGSTMIDSSIKTKLNSLKMTMKGV